MSLMGAFLVAVDAPVMASPENSGSNNGHQFFLTLPRETREEIGRNLSFKDISNLRSVCKTLRDTFSKAFFDRRIKDFPASICKSEINIRNYFALSYTLSIARDAWKKEKWYQDALEIKNTAKLHLFIDEINLIDLMKSIVSIWRPSTQENFRDCFKEISRMSIITVHCAPTFFWDDQAHKIGVLDIFHPKFIQSFMEKHSIGFQGLTGIYIPEDQDLDTLTPDQKELLRKHLKFIPPFTNIPGVFGREDVEDLKLIDEIFPDESARLIGQISPLDRNPNKNEMLGLKLIKKLSLQQHERIVSNIHHFGEFQDL
jgi:hypothetical protein